MELSDLWQRVFLRILKNELWRHNNFFNAKGWQGKDKPSFLNFYKQGLQNWVNVPSPILLQQIFSPHPQFKIVFRDPCSYTTVFPVIVAAVPITLLVKFSPKIGYMYHISRNSNRRSTEVTIIIFLVKNWPAVTITGAVIIQLRLLLREIR